MRKRQKIVSSSNHTQPENSSPLPIDLIIEIFSRLPLKSIARCRCVSKLWASILRRPDFTELFLNRSSSRPKLLFVCHKDSEFFFFSANQPQNGSPVVANYLMKFLFDGSYCISGVFNGLVCLLNKGEEDIVPMICNPSTGQVLNLPKLKSKWVTVKKSFGYDPIDKHLKVLSMTRSCYGKRTNNVTPEEYRVLTFGNGKLLWRKIEGFGLRYYTSRDVCINGVLYSQYLYKSRYVIVCFDVRSEKFRFVEVVEDLKLAMLGGAMIDYNGKLGLYWFERQTGLNGGSRILRLWVLEDVEKQEWSEHGYILPALFNDLFEKDELRSIEVTRENEFAFVSVSSRSRPYIIYFSPERNTMVSVEIQGIDASMYDTFSTFLYHVEDVKAYVSV